MLRILKVSAGLLTLATVMILAVAPLTKAAGLGTIEGGDIYRAKNITQKGTTYTDPINAAACDTLGFRVRIHNPSVDNAALTNVTLQAVFPSGASTTNTSIVTARADNAGPNSTSDTVTVNLSSAQSLTYVSGSTQMLDVNGNVIQTLPDGIAQAGINVGTVGVSINNIRFVQFQEKVSCPAPTPTPTPKPTPQVQGKTTTLPNTGPSDVLGLFTGASAIGAAGHYTVRRFRRG
jgi:hypothetical protein